MQADYQPNFDSPMENVSWLLGKSRETAQYFDRDYELHPLNLNLNSGLPARDLTIQVKFHRLDITASIELKLNNKTYFSVGDVIDPIKDFLDQNISNEELHQMLDSCDPDIVGQAEYFFENNVRRPRVDMIGYCWFEGFRQVDEDTYWLSYGT